MLTPMAKKKIISKKKTQKPMPKKKKVSVKKVIAKKGKVGKKKKTKSRKKTHYQRFLKIVSKWRKRNSIDFKGINFHSVVSNMYKNIPKEEDVFPLSDIDDNYLLELFNKFSGIPKELPINKILPVAINYWNLERYLEPIIDSDMYVDNSMYSGDVEDYDGSVESFLDDGYWSQMLGELNAVIKTTFDEPADRYHWYIWNVDENGKIIFTLIYSGEISEEDVEEKPEELVKPLPPTPPTAPELPKEPSETDKQIELEKLKADNLQKQIELEREKQKTESIKAKSQIAKEIPKIIKELKSVGFSNKEIKEFIKDLQK